ncbi:SAP domain containing protein [Nitzschia inconspicua]|uniref:SAP domain containing protein n=1 Tax=Nitzschia inconspicua TaxID=303405 RepID=A0A9K3KJU1_9STRA|nr:SAP domain containing protein [Nitzschia inconspicua]
MELGTLNSSSTDSNSNPSNVPATLTPVVDLPTPLYTEQDLEEFKKFSTELGHKAVEYVIKPIADIQKGVPAERIKGAAITGAIVGLLASKGIVVSSAAGLSAAYLAISKGVAGDVLRTVGGIAWDVTDTAARLLSIVANNEKLSMLPRGLAQKTMEALRNSQMSVRYLEQAADPTELEAAEQAYLESQQDLARVLEEAEAVINEADQAIAKAQALENEMEQLVDVSIPYDAAARLAYENSDKAVPFATFQSQFIADAVDMVKSKHAARNKGKDEAEAKRRAEEEEAARVLAQKEAEAKRRAEEEEAARVLAQKEAEAKRRAEEEESARVLAQKEAEAKRRAEEEEAARVLAQKEAKAKRRAEEEEAARVLAQKEAKAKRRAEEEEAARVLAQKEAKAKRRAEEEEAARVLAQKEAEAKRRADEEEAARVLTQEKKLKQEDDDEMDENDFLAAVELAQEGLEGKIVGIEDAIADNTAKAVWDAAGSLARELQQNDDFDDEDDSDIFFDSNTFKRLVLEALGKAAREAVEMFDGIDEPDAEESSSWEETLESDQDWSSMSVNDLRLELRNRGLPITGNKREMIDRLQEDDDQLATAKVEIGDNDDFYDSDDDDDDDIVNIDLANFDIEELGRQAREAVQMFQSGANDFDDEEPTAEMLAELENEMGINGDLIRGASEDFSEMTVAQLKEECRNRGLKVSGKKAELIERLQANSR